VTSAAIATNHIRFPTSIRRRWIAAWLGGVVVGIVNGVGRELIYKDRVGDLTAHQISGAVAVSLFALYFALLQRRWPLGSTRAALQVGATWVVLTASFDFLFGHYVDGKSWSTLAHDYNVTDGRLWVLVLLWLGIGPVVIQKAVGKKRATR
jgi:hypothetical protein